MKKLILIGLLIVGCDNSTEPEPEDCAGVAGGSSYLDECGGCDANVNNDCIQDCAGEWGGVSVLDDCGVCGGEGITVGTCDCEGNVIDCTGVCGGNLIEDCAGVCGGNTNPDHCYVTDIDGNIYQNVQIGDQLWMQENLKVTKYRDGSDIPTGFSTEEWKVLSTGAYAVYDDNPSNAEIYGNLYNWYAVDDNRRICPEDWHVPTDADWTVLTDYLGGADVVGGMMKSTGTIEEGDGLWYSPNIAATNESGFTAYPGGYRHISDGLYYHLGNTGNYWSSTKEPDTDFVFYRVLFWDYSYVHNIAHTKNYGFSVRCIND